MGPIFNLYNAREFDLVEGSIKDLEKVVNEQHRLSYSINQKMKDQTNDLVDLICVNKIENGLQMLSLEARIMIMDFKMAAREIVNSCRLGVLPINLARKFQQI